VIDIIRENNITNNGGLVRKPRRLNGRNKRSIREKEAVEKVKLGGSLTGPITFIESNSIFIRADLGTGAFDTINDGSREVLRPNPEFPFFPWKQSVATYQNWRGS
jgi:hypothetical protein